MSLKFWDLLAERYSCQPIADEVSYQKKLEITRGYFRPDMEVMEFGCGTGSTAISHAPYVRHVLATDGSSKMIQIAKDKAKAKGIENITFQCTDINELNPPSESLDAVLGLSILHLLDGRDEVIANVYKMLKPGGIFVTSTVCLGDSMPYAKYIAPIGRLVGLTVHVFTQAELQDAMKHAGFVIDYEWRPSPDKAAFIIGKKREPQI